MASAERDACCAADDELPVGDVEDPTMSMCCLRDLEEQRQVAQMKEQLSRVDQSTMRGRLYEQVRASAPTAAGVVHHQVFLRMVQVLAAPAQGEPAEDDGAPW